MHEISLENYNLRTDLIIEREDINGSKKESIVDKTYKVERIEDNNEKYISISFEDITDKDNFKTIENSIDLLSKSSKDNVTSTELLMSLFSNLMGDLFNSKLERVLRHSIHLLLIQDLLTFTNLRKLILDMNYRNELLKNSSFDIPTSIIDFFFSDFNELKTRSYPEAIAPIIAFIDEIPIRIPVKEPGPISQAIALISDKFKPVVLNSSSIKGIKVSECVLLLFIFNSKMQSSFSEIETDAILLDVEILKIFMFRNSFHILFLYVGGVGLPVYVLSVAHYVHTANDAPPSFNIKYYQ